MKKRLDVLATEQGFFTSREKAKASIMAGLVYVNDIRIDKPGTPVYSDDVITVKQSLCPYVSRGGLKLEKAISLWNIDLKDAKAVDIGASTGGFTDCMLQNGAEIVYCIDVGYGQLDWKLRNDNRVVNMEKCNVRYLDVDSIGRNVDFISIDVSFISLRLVLPVAGELLDEKGTIICLVKPQFEAGKDQVGKKGIVRDPAIHREVLENVIEYGKHDGLYPAGLTYSPVTGTKGNVEYLLSLSKDECDNKIDIVNVVKEAHSQLIK